jgi:hypothetical protein
MRRRLRKRARTGQDANILALEGVLVALILLGAVYATSSLRSPETQPENGRRATQTAAEDALVVLAGLREPRGNLLSLGLAQSYDCRDGASPSATGCYAGKPSDLTRRLDGYLPMGSAYALSLDNGLGSDELVRTGEARGERVSASHAIIPDWNLTLVVVDLSCHGPDMDVNATLVPLWHGQSASAQRVNATASGTNATAVGSFTAGMWHATLPPTVIGSPVRADVDAPRGTYGGAASTASCDLGASGWKLRDALNQSRVLATDADDGDASIPIGGRLSIAHDFAAIAALVPGATLHGVEARIHRPLTAQPDEPDAYVVADRVDLGSGWTGTHGWTVPRESLFGVHPVVVHATVTVPGATTDVTLDVRLVATPSFALPNGVVPIDPPYRVVLEAFLPEWT